MPYHAVKRTPACTPQVPTDVSRAADCTASGMTEVLIARLPGAAPARSANSDWVCGAAKAS